MRYFSLRVYGLMLFLAAIQLAAACTGAKTVVVSGSDENRLNHFDPSVWTSDILHYVNEYRKKKNLSALQLLAVANEQATTHSRNMALKKTPFSHNGFEERMAAISKSEGTMRAAAENVAYGQLSAEEVVKGWVNSPGHRKNIEGNYTLTGIGVYRDAKGVVFFTQLFMRK